MKKILTLLLSCALLFSLCACGGSQAQTPAETQAPQETQSGMVNPIHEVTVEGLLAVTGIVLNSPERSDNVVASYIDQAEGSPIAQLQFVIDGLNCTYRAVAAPVQGETLTDISGLYYDWSSKDSAELGHNSAELHWIEGQQGYISWYDAAPGILYCVSVDSGAAKDVLVSLANELYMPVQGGVDSDADQLKPLCIKDGGSLSGDLDGDGKDDTVTILDWTVDEFDNKEYGFNLESSSGLTMVQNEMYISYKPILWLADIDGDGLYEILFSGDCGSDDYTTGVFKWDGSVLSRIDFDGYTNGIADGSVEDINDGVITIGAYCYVLGTYGGTRDFAMTDSGSIAPVEGSIWSFEHNEYQLVTVKELPVTVDGAESLLPVGSELRITGFDGVGELYFVSGDGVKGSIQISRNDDFWGWTIAGVAETDYFENIPYAG